MNLFLTQDKMCCNIFLTMNSCYDDLKLRIERGMKIVYDK